MIPHTPLPGPPPGPRKRSPPPPPAAPHAPPNPFHPHTPPLPAGLPLPPPPEPPRHRLAPERLTQPHDAAATHHEPPTAEVPALPANRGIAKSEALSAPASKTSSGLGTDRSGGIERLAWEGSPDPPPGGRCPG